MRPIDCPSCYRAADRNAQLVVALRRAAALLHHALNHRPIAWFVCPEPECRASAAAVEGHVGLA
jgi:hypothetical protein